MPFIGLGLHILVAIYFAIHAVRTGRELYWLLILFMFPLLGSIVYLFAVYLPSTRIEHTVRKTVSAAARSLDPGRELREAKQAFDLTPTAQNQMRLAAALLQAGITDKAAELYEACLRGPFATDPEIRLNAAQARLSCGHGAAAIELLEATRAETPAYRPEQVALTLGRAYAEAGRNADAETEYHAAVTRYGSVEARVEYALWALQAGKQDAASEQYGEITKAMRHWSKHARALNKPLIYRLETAFASARRA